MIEYHYLIASAQYIKTMFVLFIAGTWQRRYSVSQLRILPLVREEFGKQGIVHGRR